MSLVVSAALPLALAANFRPPRNRANHPSDPPVARPPFRVDVDLGEDAGNVHLQLPPYFSKSSLLQVRYPVPFKLEVEPQHGVVEVVVDHYGLKRGDVLRALSTFEMRYDSAARETRPGSGRLAASSAARRRKRNDVLSDVLSVFTQVLNPETRPTKCLFVSDGEPYQRVVDALRANTQDKTQEIVLVFERPARGEAGGGGGGGASGRGGGAERGARLR